MDDDDWRVEVELAGEQHGGALGDLLRRHDLDDEARRRLGGRVIVTKDGPHVFLYAKTEEQVREAERVVRELLAKEGRAATVRITRWHPDEEDWQDASLPLPGTDRERAAERLRYEAAEEAEAVVAGEYEWEVVIDVSGRGAAIDLQRELRAAGHRALRRWSVVLVGAATEERAEELAGELRDRLPDDADIWTQANPDELPTRASFLLLGGWGPF